MKDITNPKAEEPQRKPLPLSGPGEPEPEPPEIDGYEIIESLGAGGMGIVWRAKQLGTDREVALKVMNKDILRSKGRAKVRFEREVTIAARLEHPNIARVYESGIHKSHYFYAMELIHGQTLDEYIQTQKLSTQEILQLIYIVCRAVQYAHQHKIIHRDLKYSNIMVTSDGQPHILDFGLARDLLASDLGRMVSLDGDVIGTPEFMSPEQAAGDVDAVDTRSDVYSIGIILYSLLTNVWPYKLNGKSYEDRKIIQEQEPTRPSTIITGFDRDLEAILLKTLAKSPKERYNSAKELGDDIQNWLSGRPVNARSIDFWYLAKKFVRRNRVAVSIVFLITIIILSTGFIGIYSYVQAPTKYKELEQRLELQKEDLKKREIVLNQAAFWLFLEYWHKENPRANQAVAYLSSHEQLATRFLLDPRPTDEKRKTLSDELDGEQGAFWLFILGESYLKTADKPRAIDCYEQCLKNDQNPDDSTNSWAKRLAELRLKEAGVDMKEPQ